MRELNTSAKYGKAKSLQSYYNKEVKARRCGNCLSDNTKKQTIMYKSITNFFVIGAIVLSWTACSNDEYKGEYSKDGTYEGANQVYFDLNNASDTLYNYSFGTQPVSVTTDTVTVKVKLAGVRKSHVQRYKVVVDASSSAKAGVHFEEFSSEQTIPADSLSASFPVVLLRKNLSDTKNDSIRLVLRLEASDDLGVRFPDKVKRVITFDNVLEKPYWWDNPTLQAMGLPAYTPAKFRYLLSLYNSDLSELESAIRNNRKWTLLYRNIQKLKAYFAANPE